MLVTRMFPKKNKINAPVTTLREFYHRRNKVLIIRNARGMGDILVHRMIFEDFKKIMPEMHLTFACPKQYHDLMQKHPFIDELIDSGHVNRFNYPISYDTSQCCIKYECKTAPIVDKPRPDIWAEHCGVKLTSHNMHVPFISNNTIQTGILQVKQAKNMNFKLYFKNSPNVLFCPIAFEKLRTLTDQQIEAVIEHLRIKNCFIYSTHHSKVPILEKLNVPVLYGATIPDWLSYIHAADYVISVDTATFHYAGGIKKPLVGIFTYADGKLRGKYYDFIMVQKHRDNGNWQCGPCYNHVMCSHPKCTNPLSLVDPKPCLTELTNEEIITGIEKMFNKWNI